MRTRLSLPSSLVSSLVGTTLFAAACGSAPAPVTRGKLPSLLMPPPLSRPRASWRALQFRPLRASVAGRLATASRPALAKSETACAAARTAEVDKHEKM